MCQVNQVAAANKTELPIAEINQFAIDGPSPAYPTFIRCKFHNNCYKCGERGHYARECLKSITNRPQIIPAANQPPVSQPVPVTANIAVNLSMTQLITTSGPPKVVQTIKFEGQLIMEVWNALLEQFGHAQAENKQMKQFVKNVPFDKRNTQPQNIGSK